MFTIRRRRVTSNQLTKRLDETISWLRGLKDWKEGDGYEGNFSGLGTIGGNGFVEHRLDGGN
jgi:hypothetical protein